MYFIELTYEYFFAQLIDTAMKNVYSFLRNAISVLNTNKNKFISINYPVKH